MSKFWGKSGAYIIAVNHNGTGEKTYTLSIGNKILGYFNSYNEAKTAKRG